VREKKKKNHVKKKSPLRLEFVVHAGEKESRRGKVAVKKKKKGTAAAVKSPEKFITKQIKEKGSTLGEKKRPHKQTLAEGKGSLSKGRKRFCGCPLSGFCKGKRGKKSFSYPGSPQRGTLKIIRGGMRCERKKDGFGLRKPE